MGKGLVSSELEHYLAAHDDAAVTAALNDLYATEDSSLEPHIEALSLEALHSEEWRG